MSFFGSIPRLLFGSANERRIKSLQPKAKAINALEAEVAALSDDALKRRTQEFRDKLAAGTPLEDILVPAFATVREGAKRTLGQRHFDVQLIGGMVLHGGSIAEMKTGEGKTLVATLAVYLNALSGKGVHVVTVNDYLARRDAEWMGQIYQFLGLSVGVIVHGLDDDQRRAAYAADITYGTNNEFGFDYLRDNMKRDLAAMVQRGHHYAIVDEVDSILIDEARTPLIISGPLDDRSELYTAVDELVPQLTAEDYDIDEKQRTVNFTEAGNERLENMLRERGLLKVGSLYDIENVTIVHHLQQALKAHKLFQRDKDYIVKDGEVIIVDEFTGRMMPGRRYSESLHQALEAKEHVQIQPENQTFASITFQNYFRMYDKLAGMTGTAATEADEFADIYKLDVVEVPTNVNVARIDDDDEVYRTTGEKQKAIVALIKDCHERGQPILVGTTSIEKSEMLAEALKRAKIKHQVLNARFHEQEAMIIAQAGVPGSVTIATNMAGRGTDIQLGGNADMRVRQELAALPEGEDRKVKEALIRAEVAELRAKALAAGGLFVLGTERHESRRIDNQLRGRSGRQGDPGHSKFFLSLQDDLMRIFGTDRMDGMLVKLGLKEDEAITHPWINRALEKAQQKVEARNFDIRKNLLKFDDVMNDQRKVIFEQRIELMADQDINETVTGMRHETVEELVRRHIPEKAYPEQWDSAGLQEQVRAMLNLDLPVAEWAKEEGIAGEEVAERITKAVDALATVKFERWGPELMTQIEKTVLLQTIDRLWREHLVTLDHLRQVIGYRGYAQRDPLNEYKTESFELFQTMLERMREEVTRTMMAVEIVQRPAEPEPVAASIAPFIGNGGASLDQLEASHIDPLTGENEMADPAAGGARRAAGRMLAAAAVDPKDPATWGKVARNAPCPCGSGKKYKHCHGQFSA